jgi:hypothetical protein
MLLQTTTIDLIGIDKLQHFFFYSFIAFFVAMLLCLMPPMMNGLRRIATVWCTLIFIGLIEEYRQLFIPERTAEWLDAATNVAGVSVGVVIPLFIHLIWRYQHQKRIRTRNVLSFGAIVVLIFAPLLYGLTVVNEPIPSMVGSHQVIDVQSAPLSDTSLERSPAMPETIVQKYRSQLEELQQYANQSIEQLAYEALKEYTEKQVPLHKLLPTYMAQAHQLEKQINEEFQQIYEMAKLDLQQHNLDPAYADELKKEYEEAKEATKASIMQKATMELF